MFDKITRRADCANKRTIYKLDCDYLRKNKNNIECLIKLQDAPIAQNKMRIYKYSAIICGSGDEVREKLRDARRFMF